MQKQQAVEKARKELQTLVEELPSPQNRQREDELFLAILSFLADPQAPQDLTLKWYTLHFFLNSYLFIEHYFILFYLNSNSVRRRGPAWCCSPSGSRKEATGTLQRRPTSTEAAALADGVSDDWCPT